MKPFAGLDADIIQWEHSSSCPNNPKIMEKFVRQALSMTNKPIVAFSGAESPTWTKKSCSEKSTTKTSLTAQEKETLKTSLLHVITEKNKDEYKNNVSIILQSPQ